MYMTLLIRRVGLRTLLSLLETLRLKHLAESQVAGTIIKQILQLFNKDNAF